MSSHSGNLKLSVLLILNSFLQSFPKQHIWNYFFERTGFSSLGLAYLTKCLNAAKKLSAVIHPVLCTKLPLPVGQSSVINSLKFTLGKTKAGGIVFPVAETKANMVTSWHRSCEHTCPICFTLFAATTFGGSVTVKRPVSSPLYISSGRNLHFFSEDVPDFQKKSLQLTYWRLCRELSSFSLLFAMMGIVPFLFFVCAALTVSVKVVFSSADNSKFSMQFGKKGCCALFCKTNYFV